MPTCTRPYPPRPSSFPLTEKDAWRNSRISSPIFSSWAFSSISLSLLQTLMYYLSFETWCTRILSGPAGWANYSCNCGEEDSDGREGVPDPSPEETSAPPRAAPWLGTFLPDPRRGNRSARKCRPAPAQTAGLRPLLPGSLGSRSNTGGWMGLRRSNLAARDARRRATRPTHAGVSSKPPARRPLGRRAPCRWDHRVRPHHPRGPLGPCSSIPPRPKRSGSSAWQLQSGLRPQTVRCQWLLSLLDRSSLAPLPPSGCYNGTERAGAAPAGTAAPAAAAPSPSCWAGDGALRLPDGGPVPAAQARCPPRGADGGDSYRLPDTRS